MSFKTVGQLKKWLEKMDDKMLIEILIETEACQFQYPVNDMALVIRNGVEQSYVVLMHETFDRTKNRKALSDL